MAEMEKEGRPPENKRSRKPAHPVKREINEEMKVGTKRPHPWAAKAGDLHGNPPYSMSFAENTMNELLGWYGYDKVELRDSDSLDMRSYPDGDPPQHTSILKENSLPKVPASMESNHPSPTPANSSHPTPASRNGVTESSTTPSTSGASAKDHGNMPIIVPMIPPPLIKAPADEDVSNIQIMCAWCQKVGVKRYSLSMGSELKNFCSEKCFAACRRAYFKRNKARDEDGLGEKLPQLSYAKDTPRLVFKTNSDVLVCDWCKHIRHTKEYLDFGAGERRLQFCSAKCLNQYKMDIFYKETQAALPGGLCNPGHSLGDSKTEGGPGVQLLTPESWGAPLTDLRHKAPSPGGGTSSMLAPSSSSAASPSESGAVCSPSSAKNQTPRPHESPTLPPPPVPTLHPSMGVPPGSPPMVMTPRGPVPLPLFMEHQMMQHMRPPFLRPPHTTGQNSPLSNPMIPGIGPPQPMPPRTLGPPSSSMHRPLISPHIHPSSNANLAGMPPHPGLHMPGFPPFPPINMMPNGHIPMPPMMNFGMPSLAPLVPPPTLLVPYPVIVPLPVPIPIPVPFPYNPKTPRDHPDRNEPIPSASEESTEAPETQTFSPSSSGGDGDRKGASSSSGGPLSPEFSSYTPGQFGSERSRTSLVDLTVKAEEGSGSSPNSGLSSASSLTEGVIDLTLGRRARVQQVIQRVTPSVQVKVEPEQDLSPSPSRPVPLHGPGLGRDSTLPGLGRDSTLPGLGRDSTLPGLGRDSTLPGLGRDSTLPEDFVDNEKARKAAGGPLASTSPPCGNTSLCITEPSLLQPESNPYQLPPPSHATRTDLSAATSCNVIVNGSIRSPLLPPASEPCPDRRGGEGGPVNVELEREAVKENSCSVAEWDAGKRVSCEEAGGATGEGKPDPDGSLEDEEHTYALPLLSKAGSEVIQPVPKLCSDKTAILSCAISAPLAARSPELEPPLKRRCLRIRNQNK